MLHAFIWERAKHTMHDKRELWRENERKLSGRTHVKQSSCDASPMERTICGHPSACVLRGRMQRDATCLGDTCLWESVRCCFPLRICCVSLLHPQYAAELIRLVTPNVLHCWKLMAIGYYLWWLATFYVSWKQIGHGKTKTKKES